MKNNNPTNLEFYGNHNLDFENNDINHLEYYTISELRKIPVPEEILAITKEWLLNFFIDGDISKFTSIDNWYPISFKKIPGVRDFPKEHVVSIGPMGLRLVITPNYIILPTIYTNPVDWYSPHNREKVHIIRSYYFAVIKLFEGDHALYVDDKKSSKFLDNKKVVDGSSLTAFEQVLFTRYGTVDTSLYSFPLGKYPKYYIDTFTDLHVNNG